MPNALGALLSLVLLSTPMSDSGPRRSSRYERALTYIRVRVGDPELTPDRVAANQGISRRHLDALFAKAGSTIARTILSCRLEHAAMLLSQSPSSCPVLTIAIDSGFKSASHFSRAFRLRYGIAPTAFRRRTRAH
ncbi:MAG: helix-turn-helix domain-containing protein [Myxococcota bacterium]